jgi:hypothetical protein
MRKLLWSARHRGDPSRKPLARYVAEEDRTGAASAWPMRPTTLRTAFAGFVLGSTRATTGCEAPVRSAEWDLMRNQPIHDAAPAGSTQLGRVTHPPREVFLPGMGDNEGWFETVYASPLPPAETHEWYADRFKERYGMSDHRDGRFVLQGSLGGPKPVVITVEVSESRPLYGNIRGRFPDGPPGTQSYVFIWAATH